MERIGSFAGVGSIMADRPDRRAESREEGGDRRRADSETHRDEGVRGELAPVDLGGDPLEVVDLGWEGVPAREGVDHARDLVYVVREEQPRDRAGDHAYHPEERSL